MSYPNPNNTTIKRISLTEFKLTPTQTYKRRIGTTTWIPLITAQQISNGDSSQDPASKKVLHLVRHNQTPKEPLHWSLTISSDEETSSQNPKTTETMVLEVRGDTEAMYLNFLIVKIPVSVMPDLHSAYELARLTEENVMVLEELARNMEPPKAASRKEMRIVKDGV